MGNYGIIRSSYQVKLYTPLGVSLTDLEFLSLEYTLVVNDVGTLVVTVSADIPDSYLLPDGIIEVWRTSGNRAASLEGETVWFISKIENTVDDEGNETITITAESANRILKSRIVAYNKETAYTRKILVGDDMLKAIVNENMGSLAVDTNRRISSTSFAVLPNAGNAGTMPAIYKECARMVVLDVLKDVADIAYQNGYPLFFDMVAINPPLGITFFTYLNSRGPDQRYPSGQDPVILSKANGSIQAYKLTTDWGSECNVIYAGGDGEDAARVVGTAEDPYRSQRGPYSRKELWVDARGSSDSNTVYNYAYNALQLNRPRILLETSIANSDTLIYGVDWFFGSWLTAEVRQYSFDVRVNAVRVTVNENGDESVSATLRGEADTTGGSPYL